MKKFLFIPVANKFDFAQRAYQSVRDLNGEILIIDTSGKVENGELEEKEFRGATIIKDFGYSIAFNMIQNITRARAIQGNDDYYIFMHNDGEFVDERGINKFCEYVESLDFDKWGVVFTNYDTLCAYNTRAMQKVGEWDMFLQQYYADNDMYRRIRLINFETVSSNFKVLHHNDASNTIKFDDKRKIINYVTYPLMNRYYEAKWGEKSGEEKYQVAFNNELFKNIKS